MKNSLNNFPISPRRVPFFYGWVLMIVGGLGFIMSAPGQTYGIAPFTEPLIDALDISRVSLSKAYMLGTMASACLLIYAGKLYDRLGARYLTPMVCLLMALALTCMANSRVGVRTKTCTLEFLELRLESRGRAKAAVLPVPVWA